MALELYPYQEDAILKMRNGCILCGGVGSGKSRTSLAYYFKLCGGGWNPYRYLQKQVSLYIITTARKRDTREWDEELRPFLLSQNIEVTPYKDMKVVIDSWNNIGKYTDVTNSFFIFDEQRVVGSGAWVKSFLKITKSNQWILLSATPGDTWTDYIPVFISNGFYRNKTEFITRHVVWDRFSKFPKVNRYIDTGRLIRLRNKILVDMDFERKTVSHQETIDCTYDQIMYKGIFKSRWDPWKEEPIQNASELCYLLRKVVNSDPSRIEQVKQIVEAKDRVIVFYNFDYELDILLNAYYGDDVYIAQWNGHKHQPIPDTERWVYLVQYTAGCEGWNCIKTDTIVFYSQNYSYKVVCQASGRIDRLNTPYMDLYYYHLKSKASIDLAINRALAQKKQFNEQKFYSGFSS